MIGMDPVNQDLMQKVAVPMAAAMITAAPIALEYVAPEVYGKGAELANKARDKVSQVAGNMKKRLENYQRKNALQTLQKDKENSFVTTSRPGINSVSAHVVTKTF